MLAAVTRRSDGEASTAVYIESGSNRVFACALEWPGWCRSGKNEAQALEALATAAPRYAVVAAAAGLPFPTSDAFDVVERLPGSAGTDFGVPGEITSLDTEPLLAQEAERLSGLVGASWRVFDQVAAAAPAQLRKGPRGGGRDRDAIIAHVLAAEAAYARKLGIRQSPPLPEDRAAITALRAAIAKALAAPSDGAAVVEKGWPQRYAARRITWHVLDHAWEIEDRSDAP